MVEDEAGLEQGNIRTARLGLKMWTELNRSMHGGQVILRK